MLRSPIEQLTRQMQELQRASAGIVRVRELLGLRGQIPDGPGAPLPAGPARRRVRRVSFGYGEEAQRLSTDVSFQLAPGRCWACWGAPAAARPR